MSVNSRNAADYSQKLERYCNARDLPSPEYDVNESDGKFICTVKIRGNGEYSSRNSESEAQAKDYASLVALAEMGLSLLNINEAEIHSTRAHDIELPEKNYKEMVNKYCQKNYLLPRPEYVTELSDDTIGFVSVLTVCGKTYRSKPCGSKKKAEQNVARIAALDIGLVKINERKGGEGPLKSSVTNSSSSLGGLSSSLGSRSSDRRSADVSESITSNYKGRLQEFMAKRGLGINPEYSTEAGHGEFVSTVTLTYYSRETRQFKGNRHPNKKSAEQSAAKQACISCGLENE